MLTECVRSLAFQYPSIIGFLHILTSIKQSQINMIWVNRSSLLFTMLNYNQCMMYLHVNLLMYLVIHHHFS